MTWTFASFHDQSYQFLNVARSNVLICIMIFDWILLLHVFMQQEQGLFITYTSAEGIWDLHVRLINISKKIYKGRFPFEQNFRKVGIRGKWYRNQFQERFPEISHWLFNFRNSNHSTENSRNSGSKIEWKAPKRSDPPSWVILFRWHGHQLRAGPTSLHITLWLAQPGKLGQGKRIRTCANAVLLNPA